MKTRYVPVCTLLAAALSITGGCGSDDGLPSSIAAVLDRSAIDVAPLELYGAGETIFTGAYLDGRDVPLLAVAPDGLALVAWPDSNGDSHVLSLTDAGEVADELFDVPARVVLDLVGTGDGIVMLTKEEDTQLGWSAARSLYLSKYDRNSLELVFDTVVVATEDYDTEGNQGYFNGGARLAWSGTEYGVYFGSLRHFSDGVTHEGDVFWRADAAGQWIDGGGWFWGTSHSFRQRVVHDGSQFVTATVGDFYPRGLVVDVHGRTTDRLLMPASEAADDFYQYVPMSTGELITSETGSLLSIDSVDERPSYDIGLFDIAGDGAVRGPLWVTESEGVHERLPKIAHFGPDHLFVVWAEYDDVPTDPEQHYYPGLDEVRFTAAITDLDGAIVVGPEPIEASYRGLSRLVNHPDGDIGWVSDVSGEIEIFRIRI